MLKNKLGEDSPILNFIHLKIRRRDGVESLTTLNPKRAGLFWTHLTAGGGADSAPLRSREPIDETSSVWY